ncbi:hypothetical protein TIFTF001_032237 [Ficus carica]|uniref:F-box protein At3g26010-like beta-propeller domain-containing protein n=1 Tax=Ficus carica TaxID=3494 RepID=A0AA88J6G6_FICCA|nr:hypothetical protein TIFTF001_032237 [Ficus carica]
MCMLYLLSESSRLTSMLTFTAAVFSSETRQWNESTFRFSNTLYSWHDMFVGNNGIIYWGFGNIKLNGTIAFDPFKDDDDDVEEQKRCRLISLPLEFARGRAHGHSRKARLGVVIRGRLRLSQFHFLKRFNTYVLKAWELDDDDHNNDSWNLVHDVGFKRNDESVVLFLVALHPEDGNVVFLTSTNGGYDCRHIFRYKIGSDDVDMVRVSFLLCILEKWICKQQLHAKDPAIQGLQIESPKAVFPNNAYLMSTTAILQVSSITPTWF